MLRGLVTKQEFIAKKTKLPESSENGPLVKSGNVKALAAFYLLSVGYAVYTQRFFFGDGAYAFLALLENQGFGAGFNIARQAAHYVEAFIVVTLIKVFHIRNLDILSAAFGLNLYLPQMISVLLCYRLLRKHNTRLLLFPVIALFGISMNVSFMMVSETHVIANVFWPIFFYVLVKDDFPWNDIAIVLVLALVFMSSYQSAAILGTLLLFFLANTMREKWGKASTKTRATWLVLSLMLCLGIAIAVLSTISPRDAANRTRFLSSLSLIFKNLPALMSIAYIMAICLYIFFPSLSRSSFYKYSTACLIIFTLYVCLTPVCKPELIRPRSQFAARSFVAYMLPLFSIPAFLTTKGIIKIPDYVWKKILVLVTFLIIGQLTWQMLATFQWDGFRNTYKHELAKYVGPVPFEDTVLERQRQGRQLIRSMTWAWTNPTLSILWSKNLDVTTIILNPTEHTQWEPFDPLVADELPKIEEFGFSFDKYKSFLKSRKESGKRANNSAPIVIPAIG
jgi:hypothetical protein